MKRWWKHYLRIFKNLDFVLGLFFWLLFATIECRLIVSQSWVYIKLIWKIDMKNWYEKKVRVNIISLHEYLLSIYSMIHWLMFEYKEINAATPKQQFIQTLKLFIFWKKQDHKKLTPINCHLIQPLIKTWFDSTHNRNGSQFL